ncbi:10498_t:CDS:2 [Paraglomus occultum]|uniref:10498_t:CDS:1 n=1 Tax=Paraglomus occultum TaxID=144539 RepID=A0A9N9AEU7_9GLOM|nr:10498_t:CDS:2 [Paraglomus occultum]
MLPAVSKIQQRLRKGQRGLTIRLDWELFAVTFASDILWTRISIQSIWDYLNTRENEDDVNAPMIAPSFELTSSSIREEHPLSPTLPALLKDLKSRDTPGALHWKLTQ